MSVSDLWPAEMKSSSDIHISVLPNVSINLLFIYISLYIITIT